VTCVRARLGINTGFAVNRFPEPHVWLRIVGEELGLRYAQFVADLLNPFLPEHLIDAQVEQIRENAERYNVTIDTTFTSAYTRVNHLMHPDAATRQVWLEWFKRWLRLAARLGARAAGSHFGTLSVTDFSDPERRRKRVEETVESWRLLADYGAELGLEFLLFEPMSIPREMAATIDDTKALLAMLGDDTAIPILLNLDVDHGDVSSPDPRDTDPYAWLLELGHVSPVVHLKQSTADKHGHWPFTTEYNAIGVVEPEKVLDALRRSGAQDVMLLLELSHREREPAESRVLSDLKASVEYWRPYVPE
jgi:sugar phosphate isomerase/epimerase